VAERVMADDLRTPWGIRTLGSRERAYNPLGYHLGAVWAHDSAIVAAGLVRHGQHHAFRVLTNSLLDAAERFDWRLPELYGGLDTEVDGVPLPYPAACSPQAWSAGVPMLLLRGALGLSPDVPAGVLEIAPSLQQGESLRVQGIRFGTESGEITVDERGVVTTSGYSLRVVRNP
jgi:glycogen debranching enzyme